MKRICFDYGHGGKDPGASYMGRRESVEVLDIGRKVAKEVRRHGIIVDETRTSDITLSLGQRARFEHKNKYDYFISFHRNAFKPEVASGVETYTYLRGGYKANILAKRIQNSLVKIGFRNRGVKKANFYLLRQTKAPAVLIEIGFIDHTGDNYLFDHKKQEIIKALVEVIVNI